MGNSSFLTPYWQLMRGDKPIGFFLLWWPIMWSLWLCSQGSPQLINVVIFTLGCFLMRSAGCVINDIADRHIDNQIERTKNRPLTANIITLKQALICFFLLISLSFVLVLATNTTTIVLSSVALFLAVLYPFTKRWLMCPQFFLGAAFSWGMIMTLTAEEQPLEAWIFVLYGSVLIWTVAYDTFYAMVDKQDDLIAGVKSSAIWFGDYIQIITGLLQAVFLSGLIATGIALNLTWPYYLSLGCSGLVCIYQQWLIKDDTSELCFKAFLSNQWIGLIIFIGIVFSQT
jgi:4-hydroxybenzoate polyprenyltransferase